MVYPYEDLPPGEAPFAAPRAERRSILPAALVAVAVAALGPLLGWIWYQIAPRLTVIKVADPSVPAGYGFIYADPEPEQPIAADGWFVIIGVVTGLVCAVLAWTILRRHRGVSVLVGLALGSLAAATLAAIVGYRLAETDFDRIRDAVAVGTQVAAPLGLRSTGLDLRDLWPFQLTGVVAIQALAAVFAYTFLAGFSPHADLRGPEPGEAIGDGRAGALASSDQADPEDRPTWPAPPAPGGAG